MYDDWDDDDLVSEIEVRGLELLPTANRRAMISALLEDDD